MIKRSHALALSPAFARASFLFRLSSSLGLFAIKIQISPRRVFMLDVSATAAIRGTALEFVCATALTYHEGTDFIYCYRATALCFIRPSRLRAKISPPREDARYLHVRQWNPQISNSHWFMIFTSSPGTIFHFFFHPTSSTRILHSFLRLNILEVILYFTLSVYFCKHPREHHSKAWFTSAHKWSWHSQSGSVQKLVKGTTPKGTSWIYWRKTRPL